MIPATLTIDGIPWEVKLADLTHSRLGECRMEECQIVLANRLTEPLREQTFYHELIHAMFTTRGLDNAKYTEEEVASWIGPALYAVLKANAEVVWKA